MSIHLIRHGQSAFNAVFSGGADPMIFDAPLTQLGASQAQEARHRVAELGIREVVCSPLTRPLAVVCHGHVIEALTGTHPDNCGIVELRD